MKFWRTAMSHRTLYNLVFRTAAFVQGPLLEDGKLKRMPAPFSGWTENRDFPALAKKSFRKTWRELG